MVKTGTSDAPVATLDKNVSISLAGSIAEGASIDLTVTGCGKKFVTDAVVGQVSINGDKIPVIASIQFSVVEKDGQYIIDSTIGIRIPIISGTQKSAVSSKQIAPNINFENVMIQGTVKCSPGDPVEIFRSGDHSLKLKVN